MGDVQLLKTAPASQIAMPASGHLLGMVSMFRRNLRLSAAVGALVLAGVAAVTLTATPKYTAAASVMLDPRKTKVTAVTDVLSGLPADSSVVDTEVEVIKSRALAERVVKALKLDADPDFNPTLKKGLFARADDAPLSKVEELKRHEAVVENVQKGLKVTRSGLTYVIQIAYENPSPEKAATIADAFAEHYLLEQLEAKFEATRSANTWLNGRLAELRGQVQEAEAAVEQYKAAHGLMNATAGSTLTEQEISNLNQQLALVKVQRAESEARLNTARAQLARGSNGDDVGEALGSKVIQDLRGQRAQVSRKLAELQSRYGARHPDVLKAQGELADVDGQIHAEIQRIVSNLEAEAQVQRQRTGSLEGSLAGSRGALAGANRASVQLRELERNAESVRTLYESFLNRFKETSAQEGIEQSDARVVSHARIPLSPSSPKLLLNLALGLVLAFGAGVAAAILREALDTALGTAEDVENTLGVPFLGSVPTLASTLAKGEEASEPARYVVDKPLSSFAESFRNLRSSIQFSRVDQPVKVIAVTSSLPDEGKTTTAVCLGRSMSMAGDKVVVVDCDLRKRAMNRVAGLEPKLGLLDVLAGTAKLDDVLIADELSGTMFLPLAEAAYTPRDVFGTRAMDDLLAQLRKRFDKVILDTAPVLPVADTRALAAKADGVVVLVRWRQTARKAVESTLKLMGAEGTYVAGAVLTQVDARKQAKFGYGDPGYYYGAYKRYYAA
jgi:exopolysaccharide transport family protein